MDIGDEVTLVATILMVRRTGRLVVSIPSYNVPFDIEPPRRPAKLGEKLAITGHVTSIDGQAGKLTVKIDNRVTVEIESATARRKLLSSERSNPLRD